MVTEQLTIRYYHDDSDGAAIPDTLCTAIAALINDKY